MLIKISGLLRLSKNEWETLVATLIVSSNIWTDEGILLPNNIGEIVINKLNVIKNEEIKDV